MFQPPDWRDPRRYPDAKSASSLHLAWEFLRRNKKYQNAWASFVKNSLISKGFDPEFVKDMQVMESHIQHVRGIHWGLWRLADPEWDYDSKRIVFTGADVLCIKNKAALEDFEMRLASHYRFNPNDSDILDRSPWFVIAVNLESQVAQLEHTLKAQIGLERKQRKQGGTIHPVVAKARDPKRMIELLRIFDGVTMENSPAEIGQTFYPRTVNVKPHYVRTKLVKDRYKAACKMIDAGYRTLPLTGGR